MTQKQIKARMKVIDKQVIKAIHSENTKYPSELRKEYLKLKKMLIK